MLGKVEILIVIIVLLLTFYFVISWGAKRRNSTASKEITRYLFGVRILIIIIAIVSLILWFLM
tara:strand:+ start:2652 stop:2840 length:189 start_codon:yes stop_codon:yes gene_type:complete